MTSAENIAEAVRPIVDQIKKTSFNDDYQATTEEAMGLLISKFLEWDGLSILRAAAYALEDANYHGESGRVEAMANGLEKRLARLEREQAKREAGR